MWNWKSAVTSATGRALLFFAVNRGAGVDAGLAALQTEFVFRVVTSGFYESLTQALSRLRPARTGMLLALLVLPVVSHGLELLVHWQRGTARLGASLAASVSVTVISTAFNVFAMRHGVMTVGPGSASLASDLRRTPALLASFAVTLARGVAQWWRRGARMPVA